MVFIKFTNGDYKIHKNAESIAPFSSKDNGVNVEDKVKIFRGMNVIAIYTLKNIDNIEVDE